MRHNLGLSCFVVNGAAAPATLGPAKAFFRPLENQKQAVTGHVGHGSPYADRDTHIDHLGLTG